MDEIQDLWRKIKALFAGYTDEQERAIKDVDTWDGAASRFDSTADYCRACLINVNPAAGRTDPEDWTQSHCMLPVREPGDATDVFVRQAVHAAAGGHGVSQVKRPEDVPQEEWDAAVKRAANRLLQAYAEMEEDAPESLYVLAGKQPPESERALGIASQALGMLYSLADRDGLYLIDLFVEDGQFYAVAIREGRLYRAPVTFDTGEAVLTEAWQPVEVQHVPITRGVSITRQADGRWRWTGIACSAVLNKNAQIDSTALFRRFVERFNQRDVDAADVPLDFWHTDIELGRVDFLGTDGYVLIDSGVLRDDAIGEAVARSLQEHPEAWGQSIAYTPLSPPGRLDVGAGMTFPVWEDGQLRRVALLPQDQAAAWFTTIQTRSVEMDQKILEALKILVGEEQALALAAQVDGVNWRVKHEQLIARESGAGACAIFDCTCALAGEAEGAVSKSERALGIASQALEMLYRLADKDGLYLIDLFVEDGQFYAVATREGRLYRAPVTFDTGEAVLTEAWQPVEVQHVPITRGISIREAEGAVSKSDATPTPSETPEAPEVRAVLEIRAALAENNAALAEVVHAITDMDVRLQLLERSEQQRREAWLADLPALQPRELVRPRDARPAEAISEVPSSERVKQVLAEKGIA